MAAEANVPAQSSPAGKPEGDAPLTSPKSKAALVVVSLGADRASQIYKAAWITPGTYWKRRSANPQPETFWKRYQRHCSPSLLISL